MLILNITYYIKEGKRDAFMSAIKELGIYEASISEKGCAAYDYYYPTTGSNTVFLNEIWEDEDCQLAHTRTGHFATLQELKKEYVQSVNINKYNAKRL